LIGHDNAATSEANHRPGDPLDEPVVPLKNVVEVFDLSDFNYITHSCEFKIRIYI
jgi:hypothetical protein